MPTVSGLEPPQEEQEAAEASAQKQGVIFVLENASLETAKVGKDFKLLNCDDHAQFLKRHGKDPADYRPDIAHQEITLKMSGCKKWQRMCFAVLEANMKPQQALLAILDSPLSKAGKLKGLYIRTRKNVLIEVNPQVRLPRTFKRFCGLLVQLLQKLSIRATNGPDKLLKVIKGPVTKHFPLNAERVGLSHKSPEIVTLPQYVQTISEESVPVFVVGAMAHGKIDITYVDKFMSISQYPLSAAYCIGRITNALEQHWNII